MSKRKPLPKMTPPSPIDQLLDPKPSRKAVDRTSELPKDIKTEKQHSVDELSVHDTSAQGRGVAQDSIDPTLSKTKTTYYIPTHLAERIDLAHAQARIYTRGSRYKASKSEFIEAAMQYALDEFDRNRGRSEIVHNLTDLLSIRES